MKKYEKFIPEGMRDMLFEECNTRKMLESAISSTLGKRGYNRVETPSIEFFDLFNRSSVGVSCEEMYKMTDARGRLIVARPDNTLPIARLVATRLKNAELPLRMYYAQTVFRQNPALAGHRDEILQSGIELIGMKGLRADLEVLALSIDALTSCNTLDFRIEIGNAGFYKYILSKLNADESTKYKITELIENKNAPALNALLDELGDNSTTQMLRLLPTMFGDEEVIDAAIALCNDDEVTALLTYLRQVYRALGELGYGGKITIDLGLVHGGSYYTGIVFRGYVEGSGLAVISGGRYDGLLGELGNDCPAVGFAIDVDELTQAVISHGGAVETSVPDVLVFAQDNMEMRQQIYAKSLTEQGLVCVTWLGDNIEKARSYALNKGIGRIDIVKADGIETVEV